MSFPAEHVARASITSPQSVRQVASTVLTDGGLELEASKGWQANVEGSLGATAMPMAAVEGEVTVQAANASNSLSTSCEEQAMGEREQLALNVNALRAEDPAPLVDVGVGGIGPEQAAVSVILTEVEEGAFGADTSNGESATAGADTSNGESATAGGSDYVPQDLGESHDGVLGSQTLSPSKQPSRVSIFSLDSSIVDSDGHGLAPSVGDIDLDDLDGVNCSDMMNFDEPSLGQERHFFLGAQV